MHVYIYIYMYILHDEIQIFYESNEYNAIHQ